jgi:hypothetical protein
MSIFNWTRFLKRWSQELLVSLGDEINTLPPDVLKSGWLGFEGATETQIAQAEDRLGLVLPPSYRAFLKVTNGWRYTTPFIYRLWPVEAIALFSERRREWLDAFLMQHDESYLNYPRAQSHYTEILDDEYLVYGDEQDCSKLRLEYLFSALEISDRGDASIYLLNPKIVAANGEWEAWFFGDWLPGADRYPSFQELMEAEYENFLELRDVPSTVISVGNARSPHSPVSARSIAESLAESVTEASQADETCDQPECWHALGRFAVEIQTRRRTAPGALQHQLYAHHLETRASLTLPDGEFQGLADWMLHQLSDSPFRHPLSNQTTPEPISASDDLTSGAIAPSSQTATVDRQTQRQPSSVLSARLQIHLGDESAMSPLVITNHWSSFTLKLVLTIAHASGYSSLTAPLTVSIQTIAHNLITGQVSQLGDEIILQMLPTQTALTVALPVTGLQSGIYRLQILATPHASGTVSAYAEVPLLKVV